MTITLPSFLPYYMKKIFTTLCASNSDVRFFYLNRVERCSVLTQAELYSVIAHYIAIILPFDWSVQFISAFSSDRTVAASCNYVKFNGWLKPTLTLASRPQCKFCVGNLNARGQFCC